MMSLYDERAFDLNVFDYEPLMLYDQHNGSNK